MSSKAVNPLMKLLRLDGNGWNVALFEDKIRISTYLCTHCNSVCCDAVELACAHNDNDIFTYCNQCLAKLIEDNDGLCPINQHNNPIIASSRSMRRQILKSSVICPYSMHFKRKKNVQPNPNIMDTIGNDEEQKEGIKNCNSIYIQHSKGNCKWRGTLNDLLDTDHLKNCTLSNNPALIYEQKLHDKNDQIQQQIKCMTELKLKLDIANNKNQQLQLKLDDMEVKEGIKDNINQALKQQIQNLSKNLAQKNREITELQCIVNNKNKLKQEDNKLNDADFEIDSITEKDIDKFSDKGYFMTYAEKVLSSRVIPTRRILSSRGITRGDTELKRYIHSLQVTQKIMVRVIDGANASETIITMAVDLNDCVVGTILWFNCLVAKYTKKSEYVQHAVEPDKSVVENSDLIQFQQQLLQNLIYNK